jgi:hypothetical protein
MQLLFAANFEQWLMCRGLSTLFVQSVISLLRGFSYEEILQWNSKKSGSRLYINSRAKGGVVPPSVFYLPYSCDIKYNLHTA